MRHPGFTEVNIVKFTSFAVLFRQVDITVLIYVMNILKYISSETRKISLDTLC